MKFNFKKSDFEEDEGMLETTIQIGGRDVRLEVAGQGNSYTTHFRQLDPRLGRWFSVDPVFQPWQSPYTSVEEIIKQHLFNIILIISFNNVNL